MPMMPVVVMAMPMMPVMLLVELVNFGRLGFRLRHGHKAAHGERQQQNGE